MKKVLNIKNIGLLIIGILLSVLVINTKEVKATGTVTWSGPSSITIRETINHIAGPITASREYTSFDQPVTINYTASDLPTNNSITKTTVLDFSSIDFTDAVPGDYTDQIVAGDLIDSNDNFLSDYITGPSTNYQITLSIRNVVDANNVPTGNFTASLVLERCEYNESTDEWDNCSKVSPSSGVLYADYSYETNPDHFGHIEISKTVKGIGADTAEYFSMVITVNNVPGIASSTATYLLDATGYVYPITGIDASVSYNGSTINNPATITVGTPVTIYIKHGQTAVIGQVTKSSGETFDAIPKGAVYSGKPRSYNRDKAPQIKRLGELADGSWVFGSYFTVSEDAKDYTPSFIVNNGNITSGYSVPNTGIDSGTNTLDFYNEKEMSVVTGIVTIVLPFIIIVGISIGGIFLIRYLRNNKLASK